MLTNQVLQSAIDSLSSFSKVNFAVADAKGRVIVSTFQDFDLDPSHILEFAESYAETQQINGAYLLKVVKDDEIRYICISQGRGDDALLFGRIAVAHMLELLIAYTDSFDKDSFMQNLILDNLLFVDIFNRSKKLGIPFGKNRAVFIIETGSVSNSDVLELLRQLFPISSGDHITAVDESDVLLIKTLEDDEDYKVLDETARSIVELISVEIVKKVKVSYGNPVPDLQHLSKSYKEAKMALEIAGTFYAGRQVIAYRSLGIGRLIYQLPEDLCSLYIDEIFENKKPTDLDDETLQTVNRFFTSDLNISETSRQLVIHRNTLIYRLERLQQQTGLDIRKFDDALAFKIALMVDKHLKNKEAK